jgi:hypothetical protein
MPAPLFLSVSALCAIVLALVAGAFSIWCGSRWADTEKRYIIQGIPTLACFGVCMYVDWRYRVFWFVGIFNVVYFLTVWVNRLARRPRKEDIRSK